MFSRHKKQKDSRMGRLQNGMSGRPSESFLHADSQSGILKCWTHNKHTGETAEL